MTYPSSGEVQVGSILRETYEITALLGYGGMGSVYVARHLRLPGKQVAVKVLHAGSGLSPEIFSRFRREARIASRLGHPNIVEVLDFDTLPGNTPFLVLELLKGESLAQRLRRGPMTWEQTQAMTRQVGSALRAAHRAGVVHRDLKPDNVFLVPNETGGVVSEHVKLLDFGISKITAESSTVKTLDAVLMGTPLYMSPEQALGKNSEVDARTDIFALGSILYEALSGRSPFAGENIPQIIYRIVHEAPTPLASLCPQVPPRGLNAIDRAMAKKANDRYATVEEFVTDFTGIKLQTLSPSGEMMLPSIPASVPAQQATEPETFEPTFISQSQPRPPSQAPPGSAPVARSGGRRLALALAALGLAGAAAGGWYVVRSRVDDRPRPDAAVPSTLPEVGPPVTPGFTPADAGAVVVAPRSPVHDNPGRPRHPVVSSESAKVARDLLQQAEQALKDGDMVRALDIVGRAQQSDPNVETGSLETRIYCAKGDVGGARSQVGRVPRSERHQVKTFCRRFDIDPF